MGPYIRSESRSPWEEQFWGRRGQPVLKYMVSLRRAVQKTAEPIEMPFGWWTRVDPRKRVFDGVHVGAIWRIRLNRLCTVRSDAAFLSNYFDHLLTSTTQALWLLVGSLTLQRAKHMLPYLLDSLGFRQFIVEITCFFTARRYAISAVCGMYRCLSVRPFALSLFVTSWCAKECLI